MLVAAKKKESELDTRVSAAFDYLGITLNKNKCYDEKGRRSLLPPEICVFLGVGNTLRSVLCHLATNDSMLDISERRNLYNKMVGSTFILINSWSIHLLEVILVDIGKSC